MHLSHELSLDISRLYEVPRSPLRRDASSGSGGTWVIGTSPFTTMVGGKVF